MSSFGGKLVQVEASKEWGRLVAKVEVKIGVRVGSSEWGWSWLDFDVGVGFSVSWF